MDTTAQIEAYLAGQPEPKHSDMQALHRLIRELMPACKLWFLDGRNSGNKIVSNPNIGYGSYIIQYADGTHREFYQIGLSANTTGISVYIMGIEDKKYLAEAYGTKLGKASITGYCIKFKALKNIDTAVLREAIQYGVRASGKNGIE